MHRIVLLILPIFLIACTGTPQGVTPVTPFDKDEYLGEWYEIARLDHRFERGLTEVTAHYSERSDGGIRVLNRGFDAANDRWEEAEGRAYFVGDSNVGHLKVSFFGPFYSAYNVAKLAPDYSMALVVGHNFSYAWILARTENPDPADCAEFARYAENLGVPTDEFIWLSDCGPAMPN